MSGIITLGQCGSIRFDYIELNLENELKMNNLAKIAAVSPAHFSRVFKELIGMNVTEYITTKRIIMAKNLLQEQKENIALIAEQCGFTCHTSSDI